MASIDSSIVREERKIVTALFADVVGSTAMAERLDPEDVREVVGEAVARICRAVEDIGGTIKDLAGDGVLALFGAPLTHEDDPDRAIRTGLRIVHEMAQLAEEVARDRGIEGFGVRVGIQTGLLVLGPVGAGHRIEYGATGDALNTAARLQSQARPGSVLVGEATRRLADPGYEWGEPRALELKGKTGAVVAFEVTGIATKPLTRPITDTPLVGRTAELRTCLQALMELRSGAGGVVAISGSPGLGKSRLVAELHHEADGAHWLEGRAVSYGQAVPYGVYRDLFRSWVGIGPDGAADPDILLRHKLRILGPEAFQAHPFVAMVMGLTLVREAADSLAQLSPEALQYRTFEAVRTVLQKLAASEPTVLVIEDLHWADTTSLSLTERVADLAAEVPLLLVVTSRESSAWPRFVDRAEARLVSRARQIALEPLGVSLDRALLEALVGKSTLPQALEGRILEAAQGNPFYLEELVRALQDAGAVVPADGGWRFDREVEFEVPPSIERVILARIDRLPPDDREILAAASILGREFGLELLRAVTSVDGRLPELIEGLIDLELFQPGAEGTFRFKHVLIQETAYRTLLRKRRRELHARAAQAIEDLFAGRIDPDHGLLGMLAHHYGEAGDSSRALDYQVRAARAARAVYAGQEAIEHYSRALVLTAGLHGAKGSPKLLLERGQVLAQRGAVAEARADFERARADAERDGDRETVMRTLNELGFLVAGAADYEEALPLLNLAFELAEQIGDAGAQAAVLSRLSIMDINRLRLDRAIKSGERALALARKAEDGRSLATAMDALEVAAVLTGDMATVERIAPELAEIHRTHGDLWYLQFAIYQWAWVPLASCHWDEAEARLREAWGINRDIGDRGNEPIYPATLAWLDRSRGRYDTSLRLGRQAVESAEAVDHREFTAFAAGLLGRTLLEVLCVEEGLEMLERSTEAAEAAHALIELPRAVCLLALAAHMAGHHDRARELTAHGTELLEAITAPPGRIYLQGADAQIALGLVWLREGESDRAIRMVEPVLAAAQASGWLELVAWASLVLGIATGNLADLTAALGEADRTGLPGVAWRAHAALARRMDADGRSREAAAHRRAAKSIVEELSGRLPSESMQRRFKVRATSAIEEGKPT